MLVVESKRKLVINSRKNKEIAGLIPQSKEFSHDGRALVAVNHGVEESLVLRNMGFKGTPAPILHYYNWPGKYKPMSHQRDTAAFLSVNKRALCLSAPGTGKTISTIWAADFLLTEGAIKKIIIVAPLSTLKPVWGTEIIRNMPHRSFKILSGSYEKKIKDYATPGVQYIIVNHDSFTTMLGSITDADLVIYDECTALKSPMSARYKKFASWVAKQNPWLWMLTGTPISQSPVDAWTLAKLVGSTTVPRSFTAFKDLVMQKVSTFRWIPRSQALEVCKQVLQPSVRFSLDECVDIPSMNYVGRLCEMTPSQTRAFDRMREDCATVLTSGEIITAANAAVMFSKLLQICTGVILDEEGEHVAIDSSKRYDALVELVDEIGGKCILFVPFKGVQHDLKAKLIKDGYDVELVNGDVAAKDRNEIFDEFQNNPNRKQVLLAHPRVAAHGLTLTAAGSIIWYAPIYSLEQYEQANARIRRLNTTGKTSVFHLYATPFEKELYRRLQTKKRVLSDFLAMVQGVNE